MDTRKSFIEARKSLKKPKEMDFAFAEDSFLPLANVFEQSDDEDDFELLDKSELEDLKQRCKEKNFDIRATLK